MTVMKTKNRKSRDDVPDNEEEEELRDTDNEQNAADSSSDDNMEEGNSADENGISNPGWVDSISKILKTKKPKNKKTVVLSKAKKLTDVKKTNLKPIGFEVETHDGEIKKEDVDEKSHIADIEPPPSKRRRETPNLRIKPNILERDRERTLQKIATKGVVQLFNAVKMQQKEISDKLKDAGPLEVRKEKVMKNLDKRAFLDVLMGEKSQTVEDYTPKQPTKQVVKSDEDKSSTWSVLKDDFMMTAKMKDWDKDLEEVDDSS